MTISIIILILGIGLVAAGKFITAGKINQTRAMLDGLLGANTEFKAQRQQGDINHDGNFPVKWGQLGPNMSSSQRFVTACRQIKAVELVMLGAVKSGEGKEFEGLRPDDSLMDLWRSPIIYRASNNGSGSLATDKDIKGNLVTNDKLPLSTKPFFVSAGPDKVFGTDDDITTIENPNYK